MTTAQTKNINQLNRIKACTDKINECKIQLVQKKIGCESSILEYLENVLEIEEKKLNQYIRNLTKLHHDVLNTKRNHPNAENQTMYKSENELNFIEKTIANHQKDIQNNASFSTVSVDWLESSIYLQDKINGLKRENASLSAQLKNINGIKTKTIETNQNDINQLRNECRQLKKQNEILQHALNDKQIQNQNNNAQLCTIQQEHQSLRDNFYLFYTQSMDTLAQIKSDISSNSITLKMNMNKALNIKEKDTQSVELMDDLDQTLGDILKYNKVFVEQQNNLCDKMKDESAKLLAMMERRNIQNEKTRDEENKNLIEETRTKLKRQYGEYNSYCDKKVDDMKQECIKYRENVMKEAKKQIEETKSNFETAKSLMRTRYEEEIIGIKKLFENKKAKLSNEIRKLHLKLVEQKEKHETNINVNTEGCNKEFEHKMKNKEAQTVEKIKMMENRYEMKLKEVMRQNDENIDIERKEFKMQQDILQDEIENLTQNFKKEIQVLKRFKPHHIIHVPIDHNNHGSNNSSYGSKLQQYIAANRN